MSRNSIEFGKDVLKAAGLATIVPFLTLGMGRGAREESLATHDNTPGTVAVAAATERGIDGLVVPELELEGGLVIAGLGIRAARRRYGSGPSNTSNRTAEFKSAITTAIIQPNPTVTLGPGLSATTPDSTY